MHNLTSDADNIMNNRDNMAPSFQTNYPPPSQQDIIHNIVLDQRQDNDYQLPRLTQHNKIEEDDDDYTYSTNDDSKTTHSYTDFHIRNNNNQQQLDESANIDDNSIREDPPREHIRRHGNRSRDNNIRNDRSSASDNREGRRRRKYSSDTNDDTIEDTIFSESTMYTKEEDESTCYDDDTYTEFTKETLLSNNPTIRRYQNLNKFIYDNGLDKVNKTIEPYIMRLSDQCCGLIIGETVVADNYYSHHHHPITTTHSGSSKLKKSKKNNTSSISSSYETNSHCQSMSDEELSMYSGKV